MAFIRAGGGSSGGMSNYEFTSGAAMTGSSIGVTGSVGDIVVLHARPLTYYSVITPVFTIDSGAELIDKTSYTNTTNYGYMVTYIFKLTDTSMVLSVSMGTTETINYIFTVFS